MTRTAHLAVSSVFSCCVSPDAELTLLAFALARGSVAKVLQALSGISHHLEAEYRASSLISSMASVRLRLLYRNGKNKERCLETRRPKNQTLLQSLVYERCIIRIQCRGP